MSTDRDSRYKYSEGSSSNLGKDGQPDPAKANCKTEDLDSSNSYGGKTIKTTFYRQSGTQQVESGSEIVYEDRNGCRVKQGIL
ncbi:hypothetical protein Mapa_013241 [Marchantia paleacea]|nr:hypothetical protein Mapa_013241 [Marchantia paleacea]